MPREILLGNGDMLVALDAALRLRDLYFPQLSINNALGCKSSLGIWVQGNFAWLDHDECFKNVGYKPGTLIGSSLVTIERLGVSLTIEEGVHPRHNIYLRLLKIRNLSQAAREIRVFVHNSFAIEGTDVGDTAFFDPDSKGMCHFKRGTHFLINGRLGEEGIYQYTVHKRFGGFEGSRCDAEDGELYRRPVDQGAVDSLISFEASFEPGGEKVLCTWLAAGRSLSEVRRLDNMVKQKSPVHLLHETEVYWQNWLSGLPEPRCDLPPELWSLFRFGLLIMRTQMNSGGAILASADTDIMATNRDHYAYMWPRDGALAASVLDKAGRGEITRAFYQFCARVITEEGYLWHKYHCDGTRGSTWLSMVSGSREQLPIQEDETALVIWALWQHFKIYKDIDFIASVYDSLISPAADFMSFFRDEKTRLPLPGYDLWEERLGVFTYTAAAVTAGLQAAGQMALLLGDEPAGTRWLNAAREVKQAIQEYLYSANVARFIRGYICDDRGDLVPDYTLDASLYGIFGFGLLPADDHRVVATMRALEDGLWVKTDIGGVARYVSDYYFRRSDDLERVPGNPWFISTLWMAEWYIDVAKNSKGLERARELLYWAYRFRSPAGTLAEQIHPYTGEPLSVSPLTWSHATYCEAILRYVHRCTTTELVTAN